MSAIRSFTTTATSRSLRFCNDVRDGDVQRAGLPSSRLIIPEVAGDDEQAVAGVERPSCRVRTNDAARRPVLRAC